MSVTVQSGATLEVFLTVQVNGVLTDLDADPTVTLTNPDGNVVTTTTGTHESLGLYSYAQSSTGMALGVWWVQWDGEIATVPVSDTEDVTVTAVATAGGAGSGATCAPWATLADLCPPCADYAISPDLLESKLRVATDILYDLTGRQWPGVCLDIVRPCANRGPVDMGPPSRRATWTGWVERGLWGMCGCVREDACGCNRLSKVRLGGSPIVSIIEVRLDGVVQTAGVDYRVDDYEFLVRLDGVDGTNEGWPCCQDLSLDDSEPNTWSVTYEYGAEPPPGGIDAAASLACQLALACDPETAGKCRLPRRVVQQTRQGVSTARLDVSALFKDGYTGLEDVDLWLSSVRYGVKHQAPMIGNPITLMRRVSRTDT